MNRTYIKHDLICIYKRFFEDHNTFGFTQQKNNEGVGAEQFRLRERPAIVDINAARCLRLFCLITSMIHT